MANAKFDATEMIAALPDGCTWESILYRVHLRTKLEQSEAEFAAGLGIPHEQVMQEMEEWLESFGARRPETISND